MSLKWKYLQHIDSAICMSCILSTLKPLGHCHTWWVHMVHCFYLKMMHSIHRSTRNYVVLHTYMPTNQVPMYHKPKLKSTALTTGFEINHWVKMWGWVFQDNRQATYVMEKNSQWGKVGFELINKSVEWLNYYPLNYLIFHYLMNSLKWSLLFVDERYLAFYVLNLGLLITLWNLVKNSWTIKLLRWLNASHVTKGIIVYNKLYEPITLSLWYSMQ